MEKEIQKEMTIEKLAKIIADGFAESNRILDKRIEKSDRLTDEKIEGLAVLVQNGFTEIKSELKADS